MKQYRITGHRYSASTDPDCFLSPDDPIHKLMPSNWLGELGAEARLAEYMNPPKSRPDYLNPDHPNTKLAKQMGIKPGTPAWVELWKK
jgi:hypothetical protein